jgi:hypothetical protein
MLGIGYWALATIGALGIAAHAHWAVTGPAYAIAAACVVGQLLAYRRLQRLDVEELAELKAIADARQITWEELKRAAPIGSLEAIRIDPRAPPELRAEAGAELVRRGKGVLN